MKLDEDDGTGNNDLPITSGTTLILTNERFNIDLDKATSTYKLRIRDIQETDGAIYQCQVVLYLVAGIWQSFRLSHNLRSTYSYNTNSLVRY